MNDAIIPTSPSRPDAPRAGFAPQPLAPEPLAPDPPASTAGAASSASSASRRFTPFQASKSNRVPAYGVVPAATLPMFIRPALSITTNVSALVTGLACGAFTTGSVTGNGPCGMSEPAAHAPEPASPDVPAGTPEPDVPAEPPAPEDPVSRSFDPEHPARTTTSVAVATTSVDALATSVVVFATSVVIFVLGTSVAVATTGVATTGVATTDVLGTSVVVFATSGVIFVPGTSVAVAPTSVVVVTTAPRCVITSTLAHGETRDHFGVLSAFDGFDFCSGRATAVRRRAHVSSVPIRYG